MQLTKQNQRDGSLTEAYEMTRGLWIPEPWIIDEARKKREEQEEEQRPCLQLPMPEAEPCEKDEAEESQAGSTVIIIDL